MLDVLKSLQSPRQVKGAVVPLSNADLETRLVPLGLQIVNKMRAMEAGADFSREFFLVQSDAHQQLLRIQEDYLKLGREPASINVAKLADGLIREHLQLLPTSSSKWEPGRPRVRPADSTRTHPADLAAEASRPESELTS
jgi:hypothetical protein